LPDEHRREPRRRVHPATPPIALIIYL